MGGPSAEASDPEKDRGGESSEINQARVNVFFFNFLLQMNIGDKLFLFLP